MTSKRKEEANLFPDTPDRQMTQPSGWCMTKDHETCPYQFRHGLCGCTCHTLSQTQKTQIV